MRKIGKSIKSEKKIVKETVKCEFASITRPRFLTSAQVRRRVRENGPIPPNKTMNANENEKDSFITSRMRTVNAEIAIGYF